MKSTRTSFFFFFVIFFAFLVKGAACAEENKEYIIIAQDGSGDFTSIQEGVDYAKDGDVLIIQEGTYNECVEVFDKDIDLVGVSRDECIIQYNNEHYWRIPLTIAAGNVRNLTIIGTKGGTEPVEPDEEEIYARYGNMENWNGVKDCIGYAVHVEQDYLYGRQLKFENCRILSENSNCVGIGARGNSSIIFKDCELVASNGAACIFLHDSASELYAGDVYFKIQNSTLTTEGNDVLSYETLTPKSRMFLTFQGVKVNAPETKMIQGVNKYVSELNDGWCGLNNVYLTDDSYGNTFDILNAD